MCGHATGPCGDLDCTAWMPKPGVRMNCKYCPTVVGSVELVHLDEWVDVPDDTPKMDRLVVVCQGCGGDHLVTEERLTVLGPAAVAGVQVKMSARELPWTRCLDCGRDGRTRKWTWAVCGNCDHRSRAELKGYRRG